MPKRSTLEAIAPFLGLSWQQIVGGEAEENWNDGVREGQERYIPIVASASAALHDRIAYTDHGDKGAEKLPDDLHLIRVIGDSMIPLALNGQYVLCTHEQPVNGGLAVVELEGDDELKFKRVYFRGRDLIELVSLFNPDPLVPPPLIPLQKVRLHKVWGVKF
jgi:phage repressor protein C with HTH and peptisase S24 domain